MLSHHGLILRTFSSKDTSFTEVCVHGLVYLYSEMMFRLRHTCSYPCEYVQGIEECDIKYSKFCIIIELLERIKGTHGLDYK